MEKTLHFYLIVLNIIIVYCNSTLPSNPNMTDITNKKETKIALEDINGWVPKMLVTLEKPHTSTINYSAAVHFTNAWQEVENVTGITMDVACGTGNSTCQCKYHIRNFTGCFHSFKNLTKAQCPSNKNVLCKQDFDVIPGQCCIRLVFFTTETPEIHFWNAWNYDFYVPTINTTSIPEPVPYSINKEIIYIVSSISFLVIVAIICLVTERCRNNKRLTYFTVDQSEQTLGTLRIAKETILLIYYPENNKHQEQVKELAQQLKESLNCKVIDGSNCQDIIATMGVAEWASHSVHAADKIIVISSKGAFQSDQGRKNLQPLTSLELQDDLLQKIFTMQWTTLVNDNNLRDDYSKVYNVRFATTDSTYVLKSIVHGSHFVLPENFHLLRDMLRRH